jgi:predicted alpha/beta-fold hydrolase
VVLFHGLEGSSRSHYARAIMAAVTATDWNGAVVHFRGCSGTPNRLARAYHSGDSAEIDWILRRLAAWPALAGQPLFAVGVSLGGNALLKWLGEAGPAARSVLRAAAAICPPLDLTVSGRALGRGFNRIYTRHFLATLKHKALGKCDRHPGLFDARAIGRAATLYEFDDAYTAPAHGFLGADDYWRRASSLPLLSGIALPTLLLSAHNDPFVPPAALPMPHDLSAAVEFECPPAGGHVGFLSGRFPGNHRWLTGRLLDHFRNIA